MAPAAGADGAGGGPEDLEDQRQELEALRSIYGEDVTVLDEEPIQIELSVLLELGGPRRVRAQVAHSSSSGSNAGVAVACDDGAGRDGGGASFSSSSSSSTSAVVVVASAPTDNAGGATTDGPGPPGGGGGEPVAVAPATAAAASAAVAPAAPAVPFVPAAMRYAASLLEERNSTPELHSEFSRFMSGTNVSAEVTVRHLPPLRLSACFPEDYPSTRPPSFTLRAQWLSRAQLVALCAKLDALWDEQAGTPVIFAWADWLQTGALELLALDGDPPPPLVLGSSPPAYRDERAVSQLEDPLEAIQELVEFDRERSWWQWQQTPHSCAICFSEKPGTAFAKLGACGHTFCTECCGEMFRVHIAEGSVSAIRCPLPDCRGDVAPGVVRQLVDAEAYERWHRFQVQKILNELPALVFCPRCESNGYETPVLATASEADGAEEESTGGGALVAALPTTRMSLNAPRIAFCDRPCCRYAFCPDCREAYHPNERCVAQLHRLERLGLKAEAMTSGDEDRRQRLRNELQSLRLILSMTVPCPTCKMSITRTQGCNHMICTNCTTHFCYRCGADITQEGYNHFRADRCPTFDREEVERIRNYAGEAGGEAVEQELEELRRQYPEQAAMVWNFKPPPGAWRRHQRRRAPADIPCPSCRQWNGRSDTNNHIKCRICHKSFCFVCRQLIRGVVSEHFRGPKACPNHSQ